MAANRPIDRLLYYLNYKEITPYRAEKDLVISNGYLKNAEKREGNIGSDILDKIFNRYIDLNLIWLITGNGEMLIEDKKHDDTRPAQMVVHDPKGEYITNTPVPTEVTKTLKGKKSAPPSAPPSRFLAPQLVTVDAKGKENIVFVNVKAAAGYLLGFGDREYVEKLPSFSLPGLTNHSYRAFEVDGDSMFPTLENREMVIGQWVEKLDYIREDRVHIVVTKNHGIVIKRLLNRIEKYGYIVAKSDALDNRNLYPNIEIYPDEIVEIWYAVWHGSFSFKSPTEMYKKVNNLEADLHEVLRLLKEKQIMP